MTDLLKLILSGVIGGSFGLLAAAGVFTVFVAVGMIPRFAGKTHTAKYIRIYEDMVISGTIIGGTGSVFIRYFQLGTSLADMGCSQELIKTGGNIFTGVFGLFAGIFIGCLAITIAEMLDSIPIFMRRIRLKYGLKQFIYAMAVGKLVGSLLYFIWEVHTMVE